MHPVQDRRLARKSLRSGSKTGAREGVGGEGGDTGAVAIQSLNCDIQAVSAALKAKEVEELEQRLEDLEAVLEQRGGNRWGA